MTLSLVAENESSPQAEVVRCELTARTVPAHPMSPLFDNQESTSLETPTREAFVPRSQLLFRALSRAITGAFVITPPFGSTHLHAPINDSEHVLPPN
jgi:hypothetical protein